MRLHIAFCLLLQLMFELSSCSHVVVSSGYTVELPCASPQPHSIGSTITWQFNGLFTLISPPFSLVIKDGRFLLISPVTSANQGLYVCLVRENNTETKMTHKLTVAALLDITIKVNEGSEVFLPCHLSSSSQVTANARWFKQTVDGHRHELDPVDNTDSNNRLTLLYPFDNDQTLLIKDTVMEDAGMYFCESAEGLNLSSIHIIVDVLPTQPPFSCDNFPRAWEPCQQEDSRTGEPVLQESLTEFSMKTFSYLRQLYPSKNLLFSPISISGALSHLLLGARNITRKAIESALCVPHDFHCVHFQMKKLREKLSGSLEMASQIYYNPQTDLTESFTNQSIQYYDAEPTRFLETSEENTHMINTWVANKTRNKIPHLVDSVPPSTQLLLLNAVSFNGEWKIKFNQKPKKGLFTKLDGDLVTVPLLYHQKYMAAMTHITELKAQVARFSLTGGNSFYILLPRSHKAADLQQMEVRMTDAVVRQMIEEMQMTTPQYIEVTLPQIKLNDQPDLNFLMKKLGLSSLLERPNLCGLNSQNMLAVDEVKHKALLALTEKGVEASAVTTVSFSRSFTSFTALRPFVMLLWNDQANVPLFIGRVTDP
uniref:Serpin peptidase inhibitor, clade G (C1 inhibitor), member 1 n=1 Tax=Echeneis naucrates TaxID=173247 RepID=A0A665UU40_ECHNA